MSSLKDKIKSATSLFGVAQRSAKDNHKSSDVRVDIPTEVSDGLKETMNLLQRLSGSVGDFFHKIFTSPAFDRLKSDFGWIVTICLSLYDVYHAAFLDKGKDKPGILGRAIRMSMGALGIGLGVIGIIAISGVLPIAMPVLFAASYSKSILDYSLQMAHSIYNRHLKKPILEEQIKELKKDLLERNENQIDEKSPDVIKLTELINKKNTLNTEIADKAHLVAISVTSLIGAVLLFTPAAPIGVAMLLGVTIYSCLDAANVNPFRHLARKINQKLKTPLGMQTAADVAKEIKESIRKDEPKRLERDLGFSLQPVIESEVKIKKTFKERMQAVKTKLTDSKVYRSISKVIKRGKSRAMPTAMSTTHSNVHYHESTKKTLKVFGLFHKAKQAIKNKVAKVKIRKQGNIEMSNVTNVNPKKHD